MVLFFQASSLAPIKCAQHRVLRNCLGRKQLEAKPRRSLLEISNLLGFILSLVGTSKFEIHDSVALILEYEDVIQQQRTELGLSEEEMSIFIDSLCSMAHPHQIYFLWRPYLTDVNDELVLELAVSANCEYILTHNVRDFRGSDKFGIRAITPKEFLQIISEV